MSLRNPQVRMHLHHELIVDLFAGGGGASTGLESAIGVSPDIAANHDPEAVALHMVNHPTTKHYCEDVITLDIKAVCGGRPVGLLWLSPDCTFHSKARGGKPFRDRNPARRRRGLAWVGIKWAKLAEPRVICLENVEEFEDWGPLDDNSKPDPERRGETFLRWVKQLRNCGYVVEWREMRGCDYGAPTIRKRLFLVARNDGEPITWPAPTHGDPRKPGFKASGLKPWNVAAGCIDWSIPCPSIFERKKPLVENTLKRIAAGIKRYVIDAAKPFIVPVTHSGGAGRTESLEEPFRTITGAHRGEKALVAANIARIGQTGGGMQVKGADDPLTTITAKAEHLLVGASLVGVGGRAGQSRPRSIDEPTATATTKYDTALVAPTLIQSGYGEREGQAPRALDLDKPLGTVVAGGVKQALVAAFINKHFTGVVGSSADAPLGTITTSDHNSLTASNLIKLKGTSKGGQSVDTPLHTIMAGGTHHAEVRAFLMKYYSEGGQWADLNEPMHTVPTKDRMGLVTVAGEEYVIADIGMRMLQPRELYRAQGFPENYKIEIMHKGKMLSKEAQVRMCGNSVCPQLAAAIAGANFQFQEMERAA